LFISYGELNDEDDEFWIINKKPVWNITGFFYLHFSYNLIMTS
jgi:hypothetical protein